MAVFTTLTTRDLDVILAGYDLGVLISFSPISSGIENTNYFVDTRKDGKAASWVLTLFENLSAKELPYFVALTQMLAERGLSVPAAVLDRSGQSIFRFGDKPGVLVPKFPGKALTRPRQSHCFQLGEWLARLHQLTMNGKLWRKAPRDREWFEARSKQLMPFLSGEDAYLMHVLRDQWDIWLAQLDVCPKGLIHGDLFRDNVLFRRGQISGVIDFYHSCHAPLVFDLAVAINDWKDEAGIVQGYQAIRALHPEELVALPIARIMAAWSFWLSRLMTKYQAGYQNSAGTGVVIKDPAVMKRLVQNLLPQVL